MKPLLLSRFTATSCIGRGIAQTLTSLLSSAAVSSHAISRP